MPRFVILEHDHPALHWDFMLETGGVLRTWRLESPPVADCDIRAEPLPDHRLHYLDYEGPVSGDRGTVIRWDAGKYEFVEGEGEGERIEVDLRGGKLRGRAIVADNGDCRMFRFVFVATDD